MSASFISQINLILAKVKTIPGLNRCRAKLAMSLSREYLYGCSHDFILVITFITNMVAIYYTSRSVHKYVLYSHAQFCN